jgi:hypothetical protein
MSWLFNEAYRIAFDLPPTQQREVAKRLAKKNILDVTAATDEIIAVLRAVHTAYGNKKERARAASAKSRATKKDDVAYCGDIEDAAVTCEAQAHVSVCAVVDCVAEAVPEPAQATPEAVAAQATPVVAKPKSVKRADNVAVEPTCVAPACVAPTPKRLIEAAPRRGLCAMVASVSI